MNPLPRGASAATRRFCGRLRIDGTLSVAVDFGAAPPARHLGCHVFMRGHLADTPALARTLGLEPGVAHDEDLLIAHAYRRWGAHLPVHVLGEYAVGIVDTQTRRLLLTHDALGLVPIMYGADADGIAFASHLIDLLDVLPHGGRDDEYLANYLARGRVTDARTPFAAIQRLLPGTSLEWTPSRTRTTRVWSAADVAPLSRLDNAEYEGHFNELIEAALRVTASRSGATWFSLSGGLDSSSIACVAAKLALPRIAAYSFVSPGAPGGDESAWARAVVEHCGLPWHTIDTATALPFAAPADALPAYSEPSAEVMHLKSRQRLDALFAQHGVGSVLSGHGGDALLGASPGAIPPHLVDLLFAGRPLQTWRAVNDWATHHFEPRSRSFLWLRAVIQPAIAHWRGRRFESSRPLPLPPWIEPAYAARWQLAVRARQQLAPRDHYPGRQEIADSVWALALSSGTRDEPATYDVRRPLLYRPFFEFMLAMPGDQRIRPRCDRYLQRRALRGVLPESVRRRGNKHFGTWAYVEGLARSPDWIDYLCDDPQMASLGITTRQRWHDAVRQASVGNTAGDRYFFAGVAVEVWLERWRHWQARLRAMVVG